MKFSYRVIWVDTVKNKQRFVDIDDQHIAVFIAKKKVSDGMQNVVIQVLGDRTAMSDLNDVSWPAIDVDISDIENEVI